MIRVSGPLRDNIYRLWAGKVVALPQTIDGTLLCRMPQCPIQCLSSYHLQLSNASTILSLSTTSTINRHFESLFEFGCCLKLFAYNYYCPVCGEMWHFAMRIKLFGDKHFLLYLSRLSSNIEYTYTYFLWLSVRVMPWADTLKCTTVEAGVGACSSVSDVAFWIAWCPVRDSMSTEFRYHTLHAENKHRIKLFAGHISHDYNL